LARRRRNETVPTTTIFVLSYDGPGLTQSPGFSERGAWAIKRNRDIAGTDESVTVSILIVEQSGDIAVVVHCI